MVRYEYSVKPDGKIIVYEYADRILLACYYGERDSWHRVWRLFPNKRLIASSVPFCRKIVAESLVRAQNCVTRPNPEKTKKDTAEEHNALWNANFEVTEGTQLKFI